MLLRDLKHVRVQQGRDGESLRILDAVPCRWLDGVTVLMQHPRSTWRRWRLCVDAVVPDYLKEVLLRCAAVPFYLEEVVLRSGTAAVPEYLAHVIVSRQSCRRPSSSVVFGLQAGEVRRNFWQGCFSSELIVRFHLVLWGTGCTAYFPALSAVCSLSYIVSSLIVVFWHWTAPFRIHLFLFCF